MLTLLACLATALFFLISADLATRQYVPWRKSHALTVTSVGVPW